MTSLLKDSLLKPIRVLLVEDSPYDAELVLAELHNNGFEPQHERVQTKEEMQNALDKCEWDLILSDYSMPSFSGADALEILKESGLDIPFIILSGTIGEDVAVDAMRAGANDYIIKGNTARLIPAVNRELHEARIRDSKRKAEQELYFFVAALTHDLRTPLLAELRIFELLDKEVIGSLTPQQHDLVKELFQSNQFMQHMVNNILHAYKYKQHRVSLHKESSDLNEFIRNLTNTVTIQALLQDRPHELILKLDGTINKVNFDHIELQRVLINLIRNSADVMLTPGVITVSTESKGNVIRVGVQDTGGGINPEIIPHLFKPYAISEVKKLKHVGMGLGLYLSKEVIESHGGTIGFDQDVEKGSLFYFDLPMHSTEE